MRGLGLVLVTSVLAACGSPCEDVFALDPSTLEGGVVYRNRCRTCHGAAGEGGTGPALTQRVPQLDRCDVVEQVWFGGGDMPAFEDTLREQEIADVTEYLFLEFDR